MDCMRKLIYLFTLPLVMNVQASTCNIGCTTKCGFMYKLRLKAMARSLGYKIKIIDLSRVEGDPLSQVDGVLIPGGADIDPVYYQSAVTPELRKYLEEHRSLVKFSEEGKRRDPFEFALLKNYSENPKYAQLPMLGICRGMQMMGVAQGMPLYLDLKTETGIKNRRYLFDSVTANSEASLMHTLFGSRTVRGFKLHHQGIRVPYVREHSEDYKTVRLTAFSHDERIAEALEYVHRPALGVQFHPEMSFAQASRPVFRWFLARACENKKNI